MYVHVPIVFVHFSGSFYACGLSDTVYIYIYTCNVYVLHVKFRKTGMSLIMLLYAHGLGGG